MHSYFSKGVKIGYIDTEYILENLSEYSEVSKDLKVKPKVEFRNSKEKKRNPRIERSVKF
ncbi:MAG: hypothetical protein CM15mP129_01410 [Chloroflexota bacterium]|nr:MAG: hypothetical protein CM15mP129_01410 [Chloroflexota bacterium]